MQLVRSALSSCRSAFLSFWPLQLDGGDPLNHFLQLTVCQRFVVFAFAWSREKINGVGEEQYQGKSNPQISFSSSSQTQRPPLLSDWLMQISILRVFFFHPNEKVIWRTCSCYSSSIHFYRNWACLPQQPNGGPVKAPICFKMNFILIICLLFFSSASSFSLSAA